VSFAAQLRSPGGQPELQAASFEFTAKQIRRLRIELLLHQMRVNVHDGHIQAALQQPARGLEPEQTAPITTARRRDPVAASMVSTSCRTRKVMTPARPLPGTGKRIGSEPVAISSRSKDASMPLRDRTQRRTRSMQATGPRDAG